MNREHSQWGFEMLSSEDYECRFSFPGACKVVGHLFFCEQLSGLDLAVVQPRGQFNFKLVLLIAILAVPPACLCLKKSLTQLVLTPVAFLHGECLPLCDLCRCQSQGHDCSVQPCVSLTTHAAMAGLNDFG